MTDTLGNPLQEIIVTANKFAENKKYLAQKVEVIDSQQISRAFTNSTASLLEQGGSVFVQRSQGGGGSPVLRGFEASRVLLMIDGVRMNNAIYRTGHLQNIITVDDDILEKVEILFGPSSTVYGSDALGGVIHLQTRKPVLSPHKGFVMHSGINSRYSSAYNEYTGNIQLNLGWKKVAALTTLSYSSFGDLRQGNLRNPFYGDFAKRYQYVTTINGIDTIMNNPDPNIQKFSAYRQVDFMQKVLWQPKRHESHELNIQYSTSSDIPRYDRLTDVRNGQLRWAEWYYGPQERLMAGYRYTKENIPGFFDKILFNVNHQAIEESRMQRQYKRTDLQSRIEKIQVSAFSLDLRKSRGRHELNTGVDGQFNFLKSTAFKTNINTGIIDSRLDTRYPDGTNNMTYTGIYYQHLFKLIPDKLIINDGLRGNYVSLNCNFRDTSILHLPFTQAKQNHAAISGNLGIVYLPDNKSKIAINFTSGFRSPNIDDLAKVFESAGGAQLVVPNPGLKPEKTYNFELNLKRNFNTILEIDITGFYTLFKDAIVLDRFQLNGNDSLIYDGKMTPVVANQNKASAYLYGVQGHIRLHLSNSIQLQSVLNYTYGRFKDKDGTIVPLDHIPPVYGKTGLSYINKKLFAEFYALYNGWKQMKDYNPFGEDNLQYATTEGMPAWYTLNVSAQYRINNHIKVQAAVENILDQNYRVFASGISGAGRNLVIRVNLGF